MTIAVPVGSRADAASPEASQGAGAMGMLRVLFVLLICAAFALLWRDPAVAVRLTAMVAARRASLRLDHAHGVDP